MRTEFIFPLGAAPHTKCNYEVISKDRFLKKPTNNNSTLKKVKSYSSEQKATDFSVLDADQI